MPTSVRLDQETEVLLKKTAQALHTTKTQILKASIKSYCEQTLKRKQRRPYELISDLVGDEASGNGNLAAHSEEILREAFRRIK
jgi:predicted transcriptional regulator